MEIDSYVKALAALTAWREENSNGVNGMMGVLFVIRNRAKANWHFGDWEAIITAQNQFDSMTRVGDGQTVHYPDPRDSNFNKILNYIDGIYDGSTADTLTQGALYYADLTSPGFNKTGWFAKTILANPNRFPCVAKIGSTSYYTDRGKTSDPILTI